MVSVLLPRVVDLLVQEAGCGRGVVEVQHTDVAQHVALGAVLSGAAVLYLSFLGGRALPS